MQEPLSFCCFSSHVQWPIKKWYSDLMLGIEWRNLLNLRINKRKERVLIQMAEWIHSLITPIYIAMIKVKRENNKYTASLKTKIDLYTKNRIEMPSTSRAVSRNKATGLSIVFQISSVLSPFGRRNLKCYLLVGNQTHYMKLEAVMRASQLLKGWENLLQPTV